MNGVKVSIINRFTLLSVAFGLMTVTPAAEAQLGGGQALSVQQLHDLTGTDHWKIYPNNPVLQPGAKGEWDSGALGSMTVVKVGSVFHMYYEAWGAIGNSLTDYNTLQIGHATSRDGVHWTKDPANPVLPKGTGNDWDRDGTWDPFIIYEDGEFKMWYGGGIDPHCDWGYAVSTDGVHFLKKGQLSRLGNVEDDHVVHDPASGRYYIYYWDRKHEPQGLYCAESPNETNFDFAGAQPIQLTGLPYTNTMYKFPHVFKDGANWIMYFGKFVRPGCKECMTGFATSPDGLHWQVQNPGVMLCHDAFVLNLPDDLHLMYYGPDGYFDSKNCDIRLALFKGSLNDLIGKERK
jgi:hypothetical protein